jgi:hypothetical protein
MENKISMEIVNPCAGGIDVGSRSHHVSKRIHRYQILIGFSQGQFHKIFYIRILFRANGSIFYF